MGKFELGSHQVGINKAINSFTLDHIIASGKHKDCTIQEVIDLDREFITFCMNRLKGWTLDDDALYYYNNGRYKVRVIKHEKNI